MKVKLVEITEYENQMICCCCTGCGHLFGKISQGGKRTDYCKSCRINLFFQEVDGHLQVTQFLKEKGKSA